MTTLARGYSLVGLTLFVASGCGSSGSGASANSETDATATTVTVSDGSSSSTTSAGGSSSGTSSTTAGGSSSSSTSASGSGGGASSSDGSTTSTDGSAPLPTDIEFSYDPSKDVKPGTCAETQIESEEVFLDMFVILDKSGSMTQPFGNNDSDGYCDIGDVNVGSRWCNAINALYGFFEDAGTVGTGVAYGEFANTGCSAFDMDVDFGILESGDANGQLAAIEAALNDDDPDDRTATEGAINTLIAETSGHVPTGTRKTIAILITDGSPTRCNENLDELNALLVNHYTDNSIPTFIIGMDGVDADNLEALAANAGAEPHDTYCIQGDAQCSYYSVGDGNPQVFTDALEVIRESVLGCEYRVPSAEVGLSNLDTLEVKFTPHAGESQLTLTQVAAVGACSADSEYWVDFNDGPDPLVKLCPATCDLRGDGAAVDISLKCEGS